MSKAVLALVGAAVVLVVAVLWAVLAFTGVTTSVHKSTDSVVSVVQSHSS